MEYRLEIDLALPREKMIELFDNPENMPKWQPSLIRFEPLSGVVGQEGSKTKLLHKIGGREVEMIETVERRNLPDEFTTVYEAKGAWNRVVNRFIEIGPQQTRWVFETEFRCTGVLRIMAFFMPGMFKKASRKDMQRFKEFAERRGRDG